MNEKAARVWAVFLFLSFYGRLLICSGILTRKRTYDEKNELLKMG